MFLLYLLMGGEVHGEEFSPDDFSRRTFHYNVMPIFNVTLRGIERHNSGTVFEQSLVTDGWITANNVQTWHLVRDSHSDLNSPDFDSNILLNLLTAKDTEGEFVWELWNEEHPKLAKVLWPVVAKLARRNLYWVIPDVMNAATAKNESEVNELKTELATISNDAFLLKAKSEAEQENYLSAIDYYTDVIDANPTKTALLARAECYKLIGEKEKSQLDIKSSKNLSAEPTNRDSNN